jgi:hypothetical protein
MKKILIIDDSSNQITDFVEVLKIDENEVTVVDFQNTSEINTKYNVICIDIVNLKRVDTTAPSKIFNKGYEICNLCEIKKIPFIILTSLSKYSVDIQKLEKYKYYKGFFNKSDTLPSYLSDVIKKI